ncbi:hypothetical protein LB543_01275 [Mesorhizobium sp. ESP7-2]|uniref:hypothetical protein n=1 Tax=Mesorhizobium sp. ESP7-2 TaxID=2876622 RepID=UPI001CCF1C11|nr:hypothetical protein [Mesorhizobium sp. ESP7-2]MBZ9705360.1 hypothetical protein [Mesorhizobium sp. ESP7-2]
MNAEEPKLREIYSNWVRDTWYGSKAGLSRFIRTRPGIVVGIAVICLIPTVGAAGYFGVNGVLDYHRWHQDQKVYEERRRQQQLNLALWSQDMERQQKQIDEGCAHLYDRGYPTDTYGTEGGPHYAACKEEVIRSHPVPARDIGISPRIGLPNL